MTVTRLSPDGIDEAARLIDPAFLHTPQFSDLSLSRALGRDTVVKVETLNPIRSFKAAEWTSFCDKRRSRGMSSAPRPATSARSWRMSGGPAMSR